ncbi:MAG: thioredoxin family protein [Parachlamydiales bacterium]|nr:thioredoxin family protein [Parachlamydiales bacterium]
MFTLQIGQKAPSFQLKGTDGNMHSFEDFTAPFLVIFFTCNHCPYVKNSNHITKQTAEKFKEKGVEFVAINSNSTTTYPEDSYSKMVDLMKTEMFPWVYLHDESQQIAIAYGALRTPHFYVFNKDRHLVYTGRAIDTPRDPSKMTVNNLENALNELVNNKPVTVPITNPIGCNVKWEGKDAHWMPPEACDLK